MMKIAITGKGGAGKTMLASFLSAVFAKSGRPVLAIDADPNANLAATLGFPHPERIMPISRMEGLIEERIGVRPGQGGGFYKLNPKVDDLPEKYCVKQEGIKLMVMGKLKGGGSGCFCPENALLEALVSHLILKREEMVIMDMEAGVEHLSRGTARAVDKLVIVVEPSKRSVETAYRIRELAKDLSLQKLGAVGNKIRSEEERGSLISSMPDFEFLGFIPYDQALAEADLVGLPLVNSSQKVMTEVEHIAAQSQLLRPDGRGLPGSAGGVTSSAIS